MATEPRFAGDALEQYGITIGMPLVQSQQQIRVQYSEFAPHRSARNTRLPLVPPKPKEFDSATRTGASRAVPGT